MRPSKTYELKIVPLPPNPQAVKQELIEWLVAAGWDSFVEGALDDVDLDFDYENPDRDFYGELGGDAAAISVFKFDREALEDLQAQLSRAFGQRVGTEMAAMETSVWAEGWKESFKPIATERFYIYPPWEKAAAPENLCSICIEPGMAFGSGQHATTRLCLRAFESLITSGSGTGTRVLDVGMGSGILGIAAAKSGYSPVVGTDIDKDALRSAEENARTNGVELTLIEGSFPQEADFDIVFANILAVVLKRIGSGIVRCTRPGGAIIMSGVLEEEQEEMQQFMENLGCKLSGLLILDGWVAMTFKKE